MTSFVRQLWCSLVMAFHSVARDLGIAVVFFFIFPLGFLFFLSIIVPAPERAQILVGSLMMELALININVLAQSIAGDKQSHLFDLWVSLPISPTVYVLGSALPWLPVTLVTALVTLAVGTLVFGITLAISPLLLVPALVLIWASTTGVGFLVAFYGGNPRMVNQLAQFVGIVMTFFAPVFYPLSALPLAGQYVAYVWPLTWGALLLKDLIAGAWSAVAVPSLILGFYTAVGFALMALGLRWRET